MIIAQMLKILAILLPKNRNLIKKYRDFSVEKTWKYEYNKFYIRMLQSYLLLFHSSCYICARLWEHLVFKRGSYSGRRSSAGNKCRVSEQSTAFWSAIS